MTGAVEPQIAITIATIEGRLRCTAVTIEASPGHYLTGDDLRRVPLARLVAEAGQNQTPPSYSAPHGFPATGPTDENLRYVASVYEGAYAAGCRPTKAVHGLGLTYSTAARWVALARAAGHITVKP